MLFNLLSPVMHNYLTPKPSTKTNFLVGGLVIVGVFWASLATYLYHIDDIEKARGAIITSGIFILSGAVIFAISYFIRRRVENKIVGTALKEVMPIIERSYALINNPRFRMAIPLVALLAGFTFFRKKD